MPGDLGCVALYNEIVQGLDEKVPGITSSRLFRDLMGYQPRDSDEMALHFDAVSLAKAYGAPIIDGRAGLTVMREHGCDNPGYDLEASQDLSALFRREFCQSYYARKGHWPSVYALPSCPKALVRAIDGNYWPKASELRSINYRDFLHIELEKTFEFDYCLDVYDLLSDKACTPPLQYWTSLFDPCGFRLYHGSVPPRLPPQDRRVISNFLTAPEDITVQFIEEIESGLVNQEDDIVRLVPKEGELKTSARMFAVVTFKRKLYVGLLGANLSQHILPLFSSQTMTDSEITFLKKVARMSSEPVLHLGNIIIFVLDIKRFNLRWVASVLLGMLRDLDKLYGFNGVFQDLHFWFQRCTYIYSSRTRLPSVARDGSPQIGDYCHANHIGGLEGQGQKIWTTAIQILIKKVMQSTAIRCSIIGQGDNQIIVARLTQDQVPISQTIALNFLRNLAS